METEIKRIGVLTSGGDAPGMNAAVRAVVRTCFAYNVEPFGIFRGFAGLLKDEILPLRPTSVSEKIQRGGTFLLTARCKEMMEEEGQKKAAEMARKNGLDAIVVIGGDGSYKGAEALAKEGIKVIAIPATIDLDIASTDYAIGFDTAINTAMEAIDRIRDTSSSHERCSIVEVMGRSAGYIAIHCGIATGAENILIPELYNEDQEAIVQHVIESRKEGKTHHLVINAEGVGHSTSMARHIEERTGVETRATILGYAQRGGSPTCRDRCMATMMGVQAVDLLMSGKANRAVCYKNDHLVDMDIAEANRVQKDVPEEWIHLMELFTRKPKK